MKERFSPYSLIAVFALIGIVVGTYVMLRGDAVDAEPVAIPESENEDVAEVQRTLDNFDRFFDEAKAANLEVSESGDAGPVSGSGETLPFPQGKPDLEF